MIRYSLAAMLFASPALAQTGTATGMSVVPTNGIAATLGKLLAQHKRPSSNRLCVVGDSITIVPRTIDSVGVTATGGTGPYAFSITGLPSGITTTTTTPTATIKGTAAATGTSAITIEATDSLAATGSRTYNLAVTTYGTLSLTPTASSTGALTLTQTSAIRSTLARGTQFWVPVLTNQQIVSPPELNFGVSGDTTTDLLARIAAPVAADCGAYSVLIGTNDLNSSNNPTIATVQSNLTAIWTALLATGRPVILSTILPRELATPASDNARAMLWRLNAWIRSKQGTIPGLIIVDPSPYFGDPRSALASPVAGATTDYNFTYDGLHPKSGGAYYMSRPVAAVVERWYPSVDQSVSAASDQYQATYNTTGNLIVNGTMDFSGGTGSVSGRVTGTAPDGWGGSSSDAGCSPCTFTGVSSESTLNNGSPAALMTVAGTAAGGWSTSVQYYYNVPDLTRFAASDQIHASCQFEMADGSIHVTPPFLRLSYTSDGIDYEISAGPQALVVWSPNVADAGPTVAYSGTLATPTSEALPSTVSAMTLRIGLYITNSADQPKAAALKIANCAIRKV